MPSTQEQLVHQLSATINAKDCPPAYLLIDPMLKEPLAEDMLNADQAQVTPIPLQHRLIATDQRPRLIRLHATQMTLMNASVDIALHEQGDPAREAKEGFGIGGWLFSDIPVANLAYHLAKCMDRWAPQDPRKRYLRWADRRVLEWMWPVLSLEQQQALLGPIQQWWTIDRSARWVSRHAPQGETPASPLFFGVSITPRQWRYAERGRQVHALIRTWLAVTPQLPPDYLVQASHAVQVAHNMGLTQEADILLLGTYVLQVHPRLTEHPLIRDRVAQARQASIPLAESLATLLKPQGWPAFRAALDAPTFRA